MEILQKILEIIYQHKLIINIALWVGGGLISSCLFFLNYRWKLLSVKLIEAVLDTDKELEKRNQDLIGDKSEYGLKLLKKVLARTMTNGQKKLVRKTKRKLETPKDRLYDRLGKKRS